MASSVTVTCSNVREHTDAPIVGMSLQEALKGSQVLLDEIDLSLLQRTLFYRSSLDLDHRDTSRTIDESLSRTSAAVINYWNSCLSLIREELDTIQKAVVKSHLLVTRTKREIEEKTRDDEHEVAQAMRIWEEQQATEERNVLRDQARARAFTAPARIPESPSDSDSSQKFWLFARKWSLAGPTTSAESVPHSPSEATLKRPNRVASFIKEKLRPSPRHDQETPSPCRSRPQVPPLRLTAMERYNGADTNEEYPPEHASVEVQLGHRMKHLSLTQSQSAPSTPTQTLYRRPSTATVSTRGTVRKAPVVLTRLHTDLLRIEEYTRGVRQV